MSVLDPTAAVLRVEVVNLVVPSVSLTPVDVVGLLPFAVPFFKPIPSSTLLPYLYFSVRLSILVLLPTNNTRLLSKVDLVSSNGGDSRIEVWVLG